MRFRVRKEPWQRVIEVVGKPSYFICAIVVAFLLLYLLTLSLNLDLVAAVWSSDASLWGKLKFMPTFFTSVWHDFTTFSMTYTIVLALLFGINVSVIVYYIKHFRSRVTNSTGETARSGLGMLVGLIGVGCASCGALLLTPIIGTAAVGAIATTLPLAGAEFALVGIAILLWSIYTVGKKMHNPYS